jgi:type IV secretory pathway VirB10-like protein
VQEKRKLRLTRKRSKEKFNQKKCKAMFKEMTPKKRMIFIVVAVIIIVGIIITIVVVSNKKKKKKALLEGSESFKNENETPAEPVKPKLKIVPDEDRPRETKVEPKLSVEVVAEKKPAPPTPGTIAATKKPAPTPPPTTSALPPEFLENASDK